MGYLDKQLKMVYMADLLDCQEAVKENKNSFLCFLKAQKDWR
jgi:hypothetical protein